MVNSRDPELAAPFNTSTSLNSLTGTPLSTYSSNSASLQIRTVDENGDLDMPIIGPIQCKGKTRSELAQEIADKIREGGYISDPTVNIQFADMKISVIGEVARPGQYDITNDRAFTLPGQAETIGRESKNDIVIPDINVSRVHAEIRQDESGAWILTDLGSTNGPFVNGRQIKSTALHDADRIIVGTTNLEFQLI